MKHMIIDIRNRMEFLIGCGFAVPKVARDIGRDPSTVRNELLKHRIASDKGYGCSNRLCAHFDECTRTSFDGFGDRKRKCQPKCFKSCPDFREASETSPPIALWVDVFESSGSQILLTWLENFSQVAREFEPGGRNV